jgi:hypothetical protein
MPKRILPKVSMKYIATYSQLSTLFGYVGSVFVQMHRPNEALHMFAKAYEYDRSITCYKGAFSKYPFL